jgi:TolA-binding protein
MSFLFVGCLATRQDIVNINLDILELKHDLSKQTDNNTKINIQLRDEIIKEISKIAKISSELQLNIDEQIENLITKTSELTKELNKTTKDNVSFNLKMKDEIDNMSRLSADLKFNLDSQNEYLTKISGKVDEGNNRFKDLKFNQESLDNINKKLALIEEKIFKLAISTAPINIASPEQIYNMARSEYSKDNYALAIAGFLQLIENYSDTKYAENSYYDMASAYFVRKDWKKVCEIVDTFTKKYPANDLLSKAFLLKAKSLKKLGKTDLMKEVYKNIIKNYPLTEESKIAKDELDYTNNAKI